MWIELGQRLRVHQFHNSCSQSENSFLNREYQLVNSLKTKEVAHTLVMALQLPLPPLLPGKLLLSSPVPPNEKFPPNTFSIGYQRTFLQSQHGVSAC